MVMPTAIVGATLTGDWVAACAPADLGVAAPGAMRAGEPAPFFFAAGGVVRRMYFRPLVFAAGVDSHSSCLAGLLQADDVVLCLVVFMRLRANRALGAWLCLLI